MGTDWDLLQQAHERQAERLAAAERARLRAKPGAGSRRTPVALRTAALLRQAANYLEARSVRTA